MHPHVQRPSLTLVWDGQVVLVSEESDYQGLTDLHVETEWTRGSPRGALVQSQCEQSWKRQQSVLD